MQNKARFWFLTIPHADFLPYLPSKCVWIRGQLERGAAGGDAGYLHWQLVAGFPSQQRLAAVKRVFGPTAHAEPCRSDAADAYVWKAETRVDGTQFELGTKPFRNNSSDDWAAVKKAACEGRLDSVPDRIFVSHYRTLRTIAADYCQPTAIQRSVRVFWGATGVGKSRRAWEQAGLDAYPKDPNTKFWCGYRNHAHVVIDEFRGRIDVSHLLRWLDRYPVIVEVKGSATVLSATAIWITSNLNPRDWYPELDEETKLALLRRLEIVHCTIPLY